MRKDSVRQIKRFALIVGNSHYRMAKTIPACAKDVDLLYDTLTKLPREDCFEVYPHKDLTAQQMKEAIKRFCDVAKKEIGDKVILFFFCGHGMSSNGTNYFLPPNDDLPKEEWVSATDLLHQLAVLGSEIIFLLLDCCRTMSPTTGKSFDALTLSHLETARDAYIVTACGPNQISLETGWLFFIYIFLFTISLPGQRKMAFLQEHFATA